MRTYPCVELLCCTIVLFKVLYYKIKNIFFIFCLFLMYYFYENYFKTTIRASLIAQVVKNLPVMQETPVWSLGWEDSLEKGWLPTPVFLSFLCGSAGKESICNVGDLSSIPGLGRSPGKGKGYPLQYSGLENSQLSDFHFTSFNGTI